MCSWKPRAWRIPALWRYDFRDVRLILERDGDLHYFQITARQQRGVAHLRPVAVPSLGQVQAAQQGQACLPLAQFRGPGQQASLYQEENASSSPCLVINLFANNEPPRYLPP